MKFLEIIDLAYKIDNKGISCWWEDEGYTIWEMKDELIDMMEKVWSLKKELEVLEKANQNTEKLPEPVKETICLCIKELTGRLNELNKKIDSIKNMELYIDECVFDEHIEEYLNI